MDRPKDPALTCFGCYLMRKCPKERFAAVRTGGVTMQKRIEKSNDGSMQSRVRRKQKNRQGLLQACAFYRSIDQIHF